MDSFNQKTVETILEGKSRRLGSSIIPQSMSSGAAAYLNKILGLGNRILSNSSACITGSESVLMGFEHLKLGKAKRMLCGSTEGDGILIWGAFDPMRILTSDSNDMPQRGSRPLCKTSLGFVPGGGSALIRCLEAVEKLKGDNDDQNVGINIAKKAFEAPLRQIVSNAGEEPSVIVNKVIDGKDSFGFNAATSEYGDMIEMGILDPAKVTRTALQAAGSVAGMMITTEAMVTDVPVSYTHLTLPTNREV